MMAVVRLLFPAICLLSLLGCRDAPRENPREEKKGEQAPVPRAAAAQDARPVIACFGDSLTAGFGVDPGQSYPDVLQRLLDEAGYRYRVVNAGISGDTSGGGLDRVDSVLALKPAIVVVALGGNDGLRGLPPASTEANLDETIARLKAGGAQVVLAGITLPRNYGPDYIRRFDRIYPDLARKRSVPLIPFLLAGFAENGRYMQPDKLHPTAQGYRIVAETVFHALRPLLER